MPVEMLVQLRWLWGIWGFILSVILLGALTRLLGAGLGCPDWPGCYGWLMPPSDALAIARAQHYFPAWPLELDKAWMEMIHRYLASVLGVGIGIQAWIFRRAKAEVRLLVYSMAFLVCVQGIFGALTVTMVLWPPVVTSHLLGGFCLLLLQTWLLVMMRSNKILLQSENRKVIFQNSRSLWLWTGLATFFLIVQVMLGGWTSSQYAGLVCPDFPTCQGQWWPTKIVAPWSAPWPEGQSALSGLLGMADRMAIHLAHRAVALVLLVVECVWLWLVIRRWPVLRAAVFGVAIALGLQVIVGIANVLWQLPLFLALLHNLGAALLWAAHGMLLAKIIRLGARYVESNAFAE